MWIKIVGQFLLQLVPYFIAQRMKPKEERDTVLKDVAETLVLAIESAPASKLAVDVVKSKVAALAASKGIGNEVDRIVQAVTKGK